MRNNWHIKAKWMLSEPILVNHQISRGFHVSGILLDKFRL